MVSKFFLQFFRKMVQSNLQHQHEASPDENTPEEIEAAKFLAAGLNYSAESAIRHQMVNENAANFQTENQRQQDKRKQRKPKRKQELQPRDQENRENIPPRPSFATGSKAQKGNPASKLTGSKSRYRKQAPEEVPTGEEINAIREGVERALDQKRLDNHRLREDFRDFEKPMPYNCTKYIDRFVKDFGWIPTFARFEPKEKAVSISCTYLIIHIAQRSEGVTKPF